MKQFRIFENPEGMREAVKQGWSWPAFFFSIIWALYKRMYLIGIGTVFLLFVLGLVQELAVGSQAEKDLKLLGDVAPLAVWVFFGLKGNKWRKRNLQRRGFDLKDTVQAYSPQGAVEEYLKKKTPQIVTVASWVSLDEASAEEDLLVNETKKCPACAETIKLEAKKCRFCGEEFDPEEVDRQVAEKRVEIEKILEKAREGKKQCPECGNWDTRWATIEDGGLGYWCDNCKKSLYTMGTA